MTDQSAESEESRSATDDPAPSGKIPPFSIWWTGGRSAGEVCSVNGVGVS